MSVSGPLLLRLSSVLLALLTVSASVGGWIGLTIVRAATDVVPLLSEANRPTESLIDASSAALEETQEALVVISTLARTTGESSEEIATVVEEVSRLSTEQIPEVLGSIRSTLPGLIQAVTVLEDGLSALEFLGVSYDPGIDLEASIRDIQSDLEDIDRTVIDQGETLAGLAGGIRRSSAEMQVLEERIEGIAADLSDAVLALEGYESVLTELEGVSAISGLSPWIPVARVAVVVGLIAGVALSLAVWFLGGRMAIDAQPWSSSAPGRTSS